MKFLIIIRLWKSDVRTGLLLTALLRTGWVWKKMDNLTGSHQLKKIWEPPNNGKNPDSVPRLVRHKLIIFWNFACHAKKLNEALKHNSFII
jgi:hypothetical protein